MIAKKKREGAKLCYACCGNRYLFHCNRNPLGMASLQYNKTSSWALGFPSGLFIAHND